QRCPATLKPAVHAVETTRTDFKLEGLSRRDGPREGLNAACSVLRMGVSVAFPVFVLCQGSAEIFDDLVTDKLQFPCNRKNRDQAGDTVHDEPQLSLASG